MSKPKVAVIYGGTNTEHEVSLSSAKAVIANLDPRRFDVIPIKITKANTWVITNKIEASYTPAKSFGIVPADQALATAGTVMEQNRIDVVFPVLHGPFGEDGTIQGLLELLRVPYVGCGVAASAVCMDKVLQKKICEAYGIPVAPYSWFSRPEWEQDSNLVLARLEREVPLYPLFVKPANQGSSVGITKAHDVTELKQGIEAALTRDLKIIVEQAIPHAREIECAVLGSSEDPQTSVLGEIIPGNEFYDYDAKYLADNSEAVIPASLGQETAREIRDTARSAFTALDCYGLARIDFLLDGKSNQFYLNELNTMPGFTPISMYPKLWSATGLTYGDLLTKLIELGLARFQAKQSLNYSR